MNLYQMYRCTDVQMYKRTPLEQVLGLEVVVVRGFIFFFY